jgi:hypothetical protein
MESKSTISIMLMVTLLLVMGTVLPVSAQTDEIRPNTELIAFDDNFQLDIPEQTINLLKHTFRAEFEDMPLREVLYEIADKLDLKLSYKESVMETEKSVTLRRDNISLYDALWEVLKGTGHRFAISPDRRLVLVENNETEYKIDEFNQTIQGTVTDAETGELLIGVNVIAKDSDQITGSIIGTQTDADGQFSLDVPEEITTLIFTYIGYQRQEINIDGRSLINVQLVQDIAFL